LEYLYGIKRPAAWIAKFLWFLAIGDDRRKQVGWIKVTTVLEPIEDFSSSFIPTS
jgi:hypothetical protein